ncbi:hypothetical protein U8V72_15220 [Priestia filamentosa]|uniref:hypothetical protein n=1 Tax=Priestia filamentosa TaxID=1402861 RepID=UPI00058968E0
MNIKIDYTNPYLYSHLYGTTKIKPLPKVEENRNRQIRKIEGISKTIYANYLGQHINSKV